MQIAIVPFMNLMVPLGDAVATGCIIMVLLGQQDFIFALK